MGALSGIKVLDLSRILAGPTCTQILGDLGAEIFKIEKPVSGDDTRKWGPPFVKDKAGSDTKESAYYLCSNRNKKSISLDISSQAGQKLILELLENCDVLVENFKTGGLKKYGLAYEDVKEKFPGLVYCSITGFGQTGPYAHRPGYDFLIQAMGGIMSITGKPDADGGGPMKVGVGIADVMTGMYATIGILSALRYKEQTGKGQHVDVALLDCQVAWLINEGLNYLTSKQLPFRRGNEHPNIVPYKVYASKDGYFVLAVGNDKQFQTFCELADITPLATHEKFSTNAQRIINRKELNELLAPVLLKRNTDVWLKIFYDAGVPCGPVNNIQQVFDDPQVLARKMKFRMKHAHGGDVELIGNPLKMSATPVEYKKAPPTLGEDTDEVLRRELGLSAKQIDGLRAKGIL